MPGYRFWMPGLLARRRTSLGKLAQQQKRAPTQLPKCCCKLHSRNALLDEGNCAGSCLVKSLTEESGSELLYISRPLSAGHGRDQVTYDTEQPPGPASSRSYLTKLHMSVESSCSIACAASTAEVLILAVVMLSYQTTLHLSEARS